jgi:excisionase family DNA binding protein
MGSTKQAQASLARKRQRVADNKAAASLPKSRYLPEDIQLLSLPDEEKEGAGSGRRRATKESTMTWRMRKEGYVTCREIASRIGVHKATVYRWVGDGLIEAVDFNGAYYIKWESVLRHLGPTISEVLGLVPKRVMIGSGPSDDARKSG